MAQLNIKQDITISEHINNLDYFVFAIVALIIVAAVIYGNSIKKNTHSPSNAKEYLLMGQSLTLPLFIATLVSTWYGNIFGVTQIAFEQGIYNFITQGIFWYISYIIFAFFMLKKIRSFDATSLSNLVEKTLGPNTAKISAIFIFIKALPITYAISLGILIHAIIPTSLSISIFIGVLLVALYSFWGGFRAVVFSDLIQFIIMCLAVVIALLFSIKSFGNINFLMKNLPASYFKVTGKHSISTTLVWFFLACSTTFIHPAFYQRCLAAKSTKTAFWGILLSVIIWILFDVCTTLGAMYAKATIPEASSLNAYFYYCIQILPNGLKGLFIAGILCTVISTLDSFLILSNGILLYDLTKGSSFNFCLKHTFTLIFTSALTIFLALYFDGNIESVWRTIKSFFSACLLFPVLWGLIFPKQLSDNQYFFTCTACSIVIALYNIFSIQTITKIDSFYIGSITTFSVLFIMSIYNKIKLNTNTNIEIVQQSN